MVQIPIVVWVYLSGFLRYKVSVNVGALLARAAVLIFKSSSALSDGFTPRETHSYTGGESAK
jgi:hypothetical protein